MTKASRRDLLKGGALATLTIGLAGCSVEQSSTPAGPSSAGPSSAGPGQSGLTKDSFAHAEEIFGVQNSDAEREQMLEGFSDYLDMVSQVRAFDKPNELAPATVFDPRLRGKTYRQQSGGMTRSNAQAGPIPEDDTSIAFSPVWKLSTWIERRELTSVRLTQIYLNRIEQHAGTLECFITVTAEIALSQAARCDAEIQNGQYRGPLHGIPYGMKDIIDVADVPATWGATPYRNRVATEDAHITTLLRDAGAVLLGKTTAGALAYGEIWFDGVTRNPWNLAEGSSGSSAGSASATAAGLVGFAIGTETLGSIVSPANRCGVTGLRPTFGRISRTGAMALCWTLDKIGPLTRSVEDTGFVLDALNDLDLSDPGSLDVGFEANAGMDVAGMRVGWNPQWFENASDADRAALQAARDAGVELVEVSLPDLPYSSMLLSLFAESAAAFESLTLSNEDDSLVWQASSAWPNTWRQARFISAVDLINSDRLRRQVMIVMDELFDGLDAMIGPNFANNLLTITNYTGHPQLTFKSGYSERTTRPNSALTPPENPDATYSLPQTTSLWAPLFEEGNIIALGREIERRLAVSDERPPEFG